MSKRRATEAILFVILAVGVTVGVVYAAGWSLSSAASNLLIALIWPFLLVSIGTLYRHRLSAIVTALELRVRQGAGLKLGFLEIGTALENVPNPSEHEKITSENLALIHTSFLSPKGTTKMNDGRVYYQVEVVLVAPKNVMARIERVEYHLPDAWPKARRHQTVLDPKTRFKLKDLASGTAIFRADVFVQGQQDPIHLNRFIDLSAEGPRI